ncbi:hypothetical protein ZOSMA_57G00170 [Zostera marina]|uniref:Peptidase A1 domain-containing protein n=1 Tax=Zostera marina TaxID=29655 RepID=A0A0K9NXC0_ZOSMR|nr:hypothetical protein ZOSMA_57G00170 [Zostera marina]
MAPPATLLVAVLLLYHLREDVGGEESRERSLCTMLDAAQTLRLLTTHEGGMYHLEFSIGTPPVAVKGVVDTGSSLSWTMCDPRASHLYSPKKSLSYNKIQCKSPLCNTGKYANNCTEFCTYGYTYNDGNYIQGTLLRENMMLEDVTFPGMLIGCSSNTSLIGEPGIVGFGFTNLSLIGQLKLKQFSICLSNDTTSKSPIFFGTAANISNGAQFPIRSIPFINNPSRESDYWVALKSIRIGNTVAETPWEASEKPNGLGLIAVDSGSDMCSFVMSTFENIKKAFMSEVNLTSILSRPARLGEGICFHLPAEDPTFGIGNMPTVIFNLDGADLEFPNARIYRMEDDFICVQMRGMNKSLSLWGNYQLMDMHVLFDWEHSQMSFVQADCLNL